MPAPIKYDWVAAENAFVTAPDKYPQTTLKVISKHFGIPYQTVRRYAAQHQWSSKRDGVIVPLRLRESLKRAKNPYAQAAIMDSLKRYKS